jgi:hypothetical protein
MRDKKAIQKDVLMAFILGLMVVGISLYFIFHEYFSKDDINLESCRQSVILRASAPQAVDGFIGISWADLKSKFPLKCVSQVEVIDKADDKYARVIVGEALAQCWYLFLEGRKAIFPGGGGESLDSYCVPCARIHFDEKVADHYSKNKNPIDMNKVLEEPLRDSGITVRTYLGSSFTSLVAGMDIFGLNIGGEEKIAYLIEGDTFSVNEFDGTIGTAVGLGTDIGKVVMPNNLSSDNGDILIFFQQLNFAKMSQVSSSLFYFQSNQKNPDPFDHISNIELLEREGKETNLCEYFDGVPA